MTAPAIGPELRLVLACARTLPDAGERAAIVAALEDAIDWDRAVALARWHGLIPLLQRELEAVAPERVPRAVAIALWAEAEAIARRNRALEAELQRVLAILEARGIRTLPYKGPTLAIAAYGDLALREFSDLDLLLARRDVPAAREVLCDAGYEPEYALAPHIEAAFLEADAQYHLVLRSASLGSLVELHWKTDADFPVERLDDPLWWASGARAARPRAFEPDELMLVLCIHGAKHAWSSLGWLVDIAELMRRGAGVDWENLAGMALERGCGLRVGLGLRLAGELLGAPLPPAARALAERPDVGQALPTLLQHLLQADPEVPGHVASLRLAFVQQERARERIRHVVNLVFRPSLVEWTRWPLPQALFFAYPLLRVGRLAAKYARKGIESVFRPRRLQS